MTTQPTEWLEPTEPLASCMVITAPPGLTSSLGMPSSTPQKLPSLGLSMTLGLVSIAHPLMLLDPTLPL